jgi:transposase
MRYELTDHEWTAIKPFLPNKPRGVPRVNDRRVLNGIFWVLRSGAPWRDLPDNFGPYTTGYNRFVRWISPKLRRSFLAESHRESLAYSPLCERYSESMRHGRSRSQAAWLWWLSLPMAGV